MVRIEKFCLGWCRQTARAESHRSIDVQSCQKSPMIAMLAVIAIDGSGCDRIPRLLLPIQAKQIRCHDALPSLEGSNDVASAIRKPHLWLSRGYARSSTVIAYSSPIAEYLLSIQ